MAKDKDSNLAQYPYEREFDRFVETDDGETAVRVKDIDGTATYTEFQRASISVLKSIDEKLDRMLNHLREITDIESDKGEKY